MNQDIDNQISKATTNDIENMPIHQIYEGNIVAVGLMFVISISK